VRGRRGPAGVGSRMSDPPVALRHSQSRQYTDSKFELIGRGVGESLAVSLRWIAQPDLLERIPGTHNYCLTRQGCRTTLFYTRAFNRILRPGLAQIVPASVPDHTALRRGFDRLDTRIARWIQQKKCQT
jgi:hypothetical protein